jgi:hypothetical protein
MTEVTEVNDTSYPTPVRGPDHPAPEDLLDYHAGDLPPEERERIQDHLALCRDCVRVVLDLDSFPDVEPVRKEDRLTDREVAAEWRRFATRTRAPRLPRWAPSPLPLALAATLLIAVVGLSLWVARLRNEVSRLSAPRADVYIADLVPQGETVERAEGREEAVRVPAWADHVLLILNLADPSSYPEYRVEIEKADGAEVWSRDGVRRSADGTFALEVPRRLLPAGSYRIRLSGSRGGAEEPVAEYGARIEHE